jgi:hypothetical protein
MPSPFPGMDPFIEGQLWQDFHTRLITIIAEQLAPAIQPRYVARIEESRVIENEFEDPIQTIRPDLTLGQSEPGPPSPVGGVATLTAIAPLTLTLPRPRRRRQAFITLRARPDMQIITLIEVLSPTNKRPDNGGRAEYLSKRENTLYTDVNLVELDLLRGGERLPTVEGLPPGDYYAFICRGKDRLHAQVYAWSLRHSLPNLPIPLAGADPDVMLSLGEAFGMLYDRAAYRYSLDYRRPIAPPLSPADSEWVQQILNPPQTTNDRAS